MGKVWKISSVVVSFADNNILVSTGSSMDDLVVSINDLILYADSFGNGSTPVDVQNVFPKWLPSGDYTFQLNYRATSSSYDSSEVKAQISGIEFNIIQ